MRVLNDNLRNLFGKFQCEQSDVKISFTTFCRMRPKEFNLTQYISRNRCLCQKHQNMALLLKSVKAAGANVPLNPEDFIKRVQNNDINANEIMTGVKDDKVSYEQWKRVDCEDGKKRMKIVQHQVSRDELAAFFIKQTCEFQEHTQRIKEQYKAMSDLKHGLPPNHVIVQMDFAENFTCVSADEVQSAYWNQNSITLHPVVAYYKNDEGTLNHYSYIIVSDDLGHNSGSVFAFIQKLLLPQMREDIPNIKHIHHWTVSPSSQYRNKGTFQVVSDHMNLFAVSASWNYFESGHGKGPCDGLGGTAKRMADLAVRQNKCKIQDAKAIFEWGNSSQTSIKYLFVGSEFITEVRSDLEQKNIKSVSSVRHHENQSSECSINENYIVLLPRLSFW
ncbi:uncharacterized protein [Argopecten irradians]|uniref:uncharacterized protein n=1 Tax=Argopecten irradians TaxID=31199 RepID=UPI0037110E56